MADHPDQLDRFEILRILGKGGMGTVYLARDPRLGRQVALKVLNAENLGNAETRARFLREARSAASIRHQNVGTIHEVGETADGRPFLVMEYCEGETLIQRIRRQPLTAGDFVSIAMQIAAGVAAAHANGVIHRDLKSANIIIEPNGLVKILDFGLARLLPRDQIAGGQSSSFASTSGHFFGTLHYLAPEQAAGISDERSDLFSIGVVFYQMASGGLPFDGEAPLLVLDQIRNAEPRPFTPVDPAFPPRGVAIISRLLQKDPSRRYQSATELLHDLESLDVPTVKASRTASLGRTRPRARRVSVLLAAVSLAVVGSAAYLVHKQVGPPVATAAGPSTPIRSMAVLPLNNIARNAADDFLSVGLADALVTKLQQIPSLQVRPTSAILPFQKQSIDARTASRQLGVDGILEGHFLAAGDLVRVNLQLTDSRSGYSVWAATIDGKRGDLLGLIDNVSAQTVTGVSQKLGVEKSASEGSEARSSNPAAYEQYLRARSLSGSFMPERFNAQIAALRKAIDLDPNFAAAHADLAIALSLGHTRGLISDADAVQRAEWYARQAVRLDPNLAQAHLALGRVFVRYPDRFRESAREILAALRLNATDTHALHSVVTYFISTGDLDKAQCIGDRLVRIDPQSNEALTRGYWYINSVDPEAALANAQWALQSPETAVAGHDIRAVALILQGNLAEAEREADMVTRLAPRHYLGQSLRGMIAAGRGDAAAADSAVHSYEDDARRHHWAAIRAALTYARLGDREHALDWVRRSTDLGHHSWYSMVKHPWLEGLQTDPRYQEMVTRMKADLDDVRDDMIGLHRQLCGGGS
jgi:serine/threonine-protein kinase